jgi:hypothetical protein
MGFATVSATTQGQSLAARSQRVPIAIKNGVQKNSSPRKNMATNNKKIVNFDEIVDEFRKVMTHEDLCEEDREKIIAAVVDHVSNDSEGLVLVEDL